MSELAEERRAIAELLPTLDFHGIRLETWRFEQDAPASGKTIREVYLDALYQSDLVIGLFWKTLGEWTADEIVKAGEHNIERHIYLKKTQPPDVEERDPELQRFLNQQHHSNVRFGFTIKWFSSLDELREAVKFSIEQWLMTRQMTRNTVGAVVATIPEDVPDQARQLIGRDDLINDALDALSYGDRVLITGMGGMGKSVTAAATAVAYMRQSSHHVIWVELGDASTLQVFDAIAKVLGKQHDLSQMNHLEREQFIRHILSEQEAMIVFDDVWNARTLVEVLRAIPRTMPLLATSRLRIPLDTIIEAQPLTTDAALELLAFSSRRRDLFNDPSAKALVDLLGRHAYAIEIAGKTLRVEKINPDELIKRIQNAPHHLAMPANFGEAGRTGVKSLLDASVDALDERSHYVFMILGGFFQPIFTAELLSGVMQKSLDTVQEVLDSLVERGLLEQIQRRNVMAYRLHDLTYSYAAMMLATELKTWNVQALIDACHEFVQIHAQDVDYIDVELGNVLEAVERSLALEQSHAAQQTMLTLVGDYLTARGYTLKFLELLSQVIERLQIAAKTREDWIALQYLYGKQGNIFFDRNNAEAALAAYQSALHIAQELELKERQVVLGALVGKVMGYLGDPQAQAFLEEVAEFAQTLDDEYWIGFVREMQGYLAQLQGDYAKCRELYQQNVELGQRINDLPTLFFALLNLGSAERDLQQYDAAISHHQRALHVAQEQDIRYWIGLALHALGTDYYYVEDHLRAKQLLDEAHDIYEELGMVAKMREAQQDKEKFRYL